MDVIFLLLNKITDPSVTNIDNFLYRMTFIKLKHFIIKLYTACTVFRNINNQTKEKNRIVIKNFWTLGFYNVWCLSLNRQMLIGIGISENYSEFLRLFLFCFLTTLFCLSNEFYWSMHFLNTQNGAQMHHRMTLRLF